MRAFRVRDVNDIENNIAWTRMDGTAYVLVGGSNRSYLTVSPELAPAHERSGNVVSCDYRLDGQGGMQLIPVQDKEDHRAIIVVPSGGFDFQTVSGVQMPLVPRFGNCARVVILAPDEQIIAIPHVRTLAESAAARPCILRFDGALLTFRPE